MSAWQFLLDENIDPKVATYLQKADVSAVHVRDVLGQGADDEADILPYARERDRVIVTSDVTDFAPFGTMSTPASYSSTTTRCQPTRSHLRLSR
jgi:predicted nuclease of predicted toxin-antitoxin system